MKSLQLDAPHAVIVIGIRGSGKTFFARKFADMFSAPFIEEAELFRLTGSIGTTDALIELHLSELIKTKKTIILEIEASARTRRQELARMFKKAGYTTLFVWVQVDTDTALARSQKSSNISPDVHARDVQRFTALKAPEPYIVISGKHTYATQAKIVLKKLTSGRQISVHRTPPAVPTRGQIIVR